jgi:hypothetical protein
MERNDRWRAERKWMGSPPRPVTILLAPVLLAAVLPSCGGGSGSSPPPPPSPDFTVSLAQNAVTVGVGDTSPVVSISTTALNGFASSISVAINGLPPGATTSPASPLSLQAGSTRDVTLTTPVDAAGGGTTITFAASSGTLSHAAELSLNIVPCLTGGNEQTIKDALGSAAGFADLCPGSVFAVNGPILMGSDFSTGNRLFTAGYPTQLAQKALIRVADHTDIWPSAEPNSMIWAAGTDLRIQNIRLDGNRTNNTYIPNAALVRIHGLRNKVDSIYGTDPLGSPGLEAADANYCADLTVTNNFIGPVGSHIVRTAADPVTWGDGIQIHCDRAYVAYNEIRDATDVGLMSFGGKDSVFEFNHIENWASSAFGGLGVDPENASDANGHPLPDPLDFGGTIMRNNMVETCCGQHIHVALAVGVHLWCDTPANSATCQYGTGLTYVDNQATGLFGYGLYLGGMNNAVVTGNVVTMTPPTWINCYIPGQNFYVLDHATGTFQDGYTTRTPLHWPCLGPTGSDEAAFYP